MLVLECVRSSGLREGGKGRKQMASVTHLGVVVKYYDGIGNFWRERLAYLKNVGIKYLLKKKDTYQINTDVLRRLTNISRGQECSSKGRRLHEVPLEDQELVRQQFHVAPGLYRHKSFRHEHSKTHQPSSHCRLVNQLSQW